MASPYRIVAMKEKEVRVEAICISKRYVVMGNGMQLPIVGFFDDDHMPIDDYDYDLLAYYEFGTEEIGYAVGNFDAYDMPSWEDH
jgi:hypothetical protein